MGALETFFYRLCLLMLAGCFVALLVLLGMMIFGDYNPTCPEGEHWIVFGKGQAMCVED